MVSLLHVLALPYHELAEKAIIRSFILQKTAAQLPVERRLCLPKRQCPALSRRTLEKSGLLLLGLSDLLQGILAAEVRAALLIEAHELDPRHVADIQNVLDLFNAAVFKLGDVDHAVVARGDLNERADRQDADDLAVVQGADLGDEADVVDHLLGGVARSGIDRSDEDVAVVVDVDLGAGVGADLLDGLAAGADDLTDLLDGDLHGDHLRSVLGDVRARLGDAGEHDLVQNFQTGLAAALECVGNDLHRQALVLQVHLNGRNAFRRTGDLEVPSVINTKVGSGICVYLFTINGGISIPPVLAPVRNTHPIPIPINAPP